MFRGIFTSSAKDTIVKDNNNGLRLNLPSPLEVTKLREKVTSNRKELLSYLSRLRSTLEKTLELTPEEKIQYCALERHYMKLYLKQLLEKIQED